MPVRNRALITAAALVTVLGVSGAAAAQPAAAPAKKGWRI